MIKLSVSLLLTFILFSNVHAQEVPKSDWIVYMKSALPSGLCGEEQYYKECFDISHSKCILTAGAAIDACIDKDEENLPDVIDSTEGKKWGAILGYCTGKRFEKELADKRLNTQKCSNPVYWLK